MADRRMFSRIITTSDSFLELPLDVRGLYFHLGEEADDDGFIGNPKAIAKNVGSKDSHIRRLIDNKFLIQFNSGVVAITHWKVHNSIRNDRKKDTFYQQELKQLTTNSQGIYEFLVDKKDVKNDNQNGNHNDTKNDNQIDGNLTTKMSAQNSIGKININKDRIKEEINKEEKEQTISSTPPIIESSSEDEPVNIYKPLPFTQFLIDEGIITKDTFQMVTVNSSIRRNSKLVDSITATSIATKIYKELIEIGKTGIEACKYFSQEFDFRISEVKSHE